jgi:putative peptidoglycan lipid II flippase
LFEGGRMTAADAGKSALVLATLVAGLPAYVLVKVLAPGFYARKDVKTPVLVGLAALAAGVAANFVLVPRLGLVALPLSTAGTAWLNALALYAFLHKRGHYRLHGPVAFRVARQLVAAAAMGATLWLLSGALAGFMDGSKLATAIGLAAMMLAAVTVYFGLGWLIGAIDRADVMLLLRRKKVEPN